MSLINPYRFSAAAPVDFDGFGNKSRSFNGVDDYVDLGNSTEFSFSDGNNDEPFSLSTWVKMNNNSTFRMLSKDDGTGSNREWLLATDSGGNLNIYLIDGGQFRSREYTTPLPENEWLHISATYDGRGGVNFRLGLKLYVNGVQVDNADFGSGGYVAMDANTANNVYIGRYATSYSDGNIADVRIYDTDLSSTDIANLYNGTDITTNLVGHWLKDTDDVLDHSVNSNNGENFGSIFSPDNPSPPIEFGAASRLFDGNDYISLGNSIKFGDGSNDNPFSISAWIRMNNANKFRVLSDWNDLGGTINSTFTFTTSSANKLILFLKDSSDNAVRGREYNFDMSSYENEWIHVAATYNGVGGTNADQGIKLYLNGSRVDDASVSVNTYVAMESTTNDVEIGTLQVSTGRDYSDGFISDLRLFDVELSAADILKLQQEEDFKDDIIGQWLTDNDDLEDKEGTNDGTNFGSTYSYAAPFPVDKLIDGYASACGAYSLRELTAAWAGQPVVEVRRTFDGAYSDFTAAEITDGTLATWCQGSAAFVRTWYDQSGNGLDVTQTTEVNQPRIATAGVVESDNGKPAINFDTAAQGFSNAGNFDYEGGVSWYAVVHTTVNSNQDRIWCDDIVGQQGYLIFYTGQLYFINDGTSYSFIGTSGETLNQQLRSFNFDESQGTYVYAFDGSYSSGTVSPWNGVILDPSSTANIGVGQAGAGGHNFQGKMQELIIYPNDQKHNKENIERNINDFYVIY